MGKKKLIHFEEIRTFGNVFHFPFDMKERWHSDYFHNQHSLTLELGCGKGEYTVELARRFPRRNFIGIDLKGARLWRGAKTALDEKLHNAAFIRIPIELIADVIPQKVVEEIWIPFADPYPRQSKVKKRLTSPRFLDLYKNLLVNGGTIHFKTDDQDYYDYTLETVQENGCSVLGVCEDIYRSDISNELLFIQTTYEKDHLRDGKSIKYISFCFMEEN